MPTQEPDHNTLLPTAENNEDIFEGEGGEMVNNGDRIGDPSEEDDVEYPHEFHEEEYAQELPEWILEEETKADLMGDLEVQESFSFLMEAGEQGEKLFKWDPSKEKTLMMEVYVYMLTEVGDLTIPTSSNKREEVEIFTKKDEHAAYYHLGEVYVHAVIPINFDSDYRILRFRNTYSQTVLVEIDLEFTGMVIDKGLDDDDLVKTESKIRHIMKQMETTEVKREHEFKSQHGFLSRENAHEQVLLVLTGIELLGVVAATLVQVALVKSLLENRQVV